MKKELTLRWTKTKPLTRQGRGKEEETASVASLFVLFKFKPLSKNGEYYTDKDFLRPPRHLPLVSAVHWQVNSNRGA